MKITYYIAILLCFTLGCKQNQKSDTNTVTFKNINIEEAQTLIQSTSDLVIIDVRTPKETADGIINGAHKIDYRQKNFEASISSLDKNSAYLIYCRSGGRSSKASQFMIENGFKDVTNLLGGYDAWKERK